MSWYKRLFWKIFVSVWAVCFCVMLLLFTLITTLSEQERYQQIVEVRALAFAERVIERYESNGELIRKPFRAEHPPRNHGHDERSRVRIVDTLSGRVILGPPQSLTGTEGEPPQTALLEEGRYQVEWLLQPDRNPFARLMTMLLSLQLLVILLASLLVSIVLSVIIVRPVKALREHARTLSAGEWERRVDKNLSNRGDELGELAREFDQMAHYVEATLQSQQVLLQNVSHELRAPLARLQAAAGIAAQQWGEQDRIVLRVERECKRMDLLISELLSLARIDAASVSEQPFHPAELLDELVADLSFSQPDHPVNWQAPNCDGLLKGRALLERALNNILLNACRHTPAGTQVELSLEQTGHSFVIQVRDHGQGVDNEQLPQLFKPFTRLTTETSGYGLGMSIAKSAVERLQGKITAKNHPEGGLLVSLTLPID